MVDQSMLDQVPVWAFFLVILAFALLPIEVGLRIGERRRRVDDHEAEGPVSNVVTAMLALLGFMVALTLGAATVRFDERKETLIGAVNAIETAHRNAGLLPEPHKSESRNLLREYVDIRIQIADTYSRPDEFKQLEQRVATVRESLWSHAESLAAEDRSAEMYALFSSSLNDVFEVHNKSVILGAVYRIPIIVWAVLLVVTVITTLGVGFQFGLVGTRSPVASLTLALTFALVMTIIFDIDEPGKGLISVNQQPLLQLQERMKE